MGQPQGQFEDEQREAETAEFVMAYFAKHPRAMDTVAGIAEWWMPEGIRPDHDLMRKVLELLAQRGLLERVGSGEYAHYRLKSAGSFQ